MLEAQAIDLHYGAAQALRAVSLKAEPGKVTCVLGRNGVVRFGPIQRTLPTVSPATLTATLRALERERLVRRVPVLGDRRAGFAYELTTPGLALYRNLIPLAGWLRQR